VNAVNAPLLAQRDVADLVQSAEFLWLVAALVGAMLLGAILLSWIERWRKRQMSDGPVGDVKQLGGYRAMLERGELTQQEYDRIKHKEARRLRNKIVAKPEPEPQAPSPQPAVQEPPPPETPAS